MKLGVIDPGGALRAIYAAGVFDRWLDLGVNVDVAIGVSAGSANLAAYLANQKMRNYVFYTEYSQRPQYMGLHNFLRTGSYLNLEYIYGTLSRQEGEYPLDFPRMMANPSELIVVATDARTGQPKYFDKRDFRQDWYDPFKASSAIPGICRSWKIDGHPFFDGAISDPIPLDKAFERGCDRVVVILSRPKHDRRQPGTDPIMARRIRLKYPKAAARLVDYCNTYNRAVERSLELEKEGKVLIIAPDDISGIHRLGRDAEPLKRLHSKGYQDAEAVLPFIAG